ncbi:natural killer cell receptor 2B4-like [Ctenopharyngodon idella]|uniref:natural killer cell receptor 2B4-like n=1 Tax=Ctenopharyngodon idella TaxID=7959 RepID=UPI00222F0BD0|nr:natural killer cell receptor 2B4-like [Ctenopharyngodon idella]
MEYSHHLMLFMTFLISSTASRNYVFVQTGDSFTLDIKNKTLPPFRRFVWINDKSENVVRFLNESGLKPHSLYKDRVDLNNKTFSLTMKNVQKRDSGLYTAKATGQQETTVAEYNVSVIDPVDSPVLNWNATMISVNSCIVDVTCSGHVLILSTSYQINNCSQVEVTSSEMKTLTLHCIENIVVCNYSNPVSWKNDTIEINPICTPHEHTSTQNPKESHSSFPLHWLLIIAVVPLLVFAAVSVICCSNKKRKKGAQEEDNHTIYAQVQSKNKVQRPLEMLGKSANSQTVYGFTEEHKQTQNTSQAQTENQPSTTYSTIGRRQKTSFPTETHHTIYSTVCKSSHGRQPGHS